MLKEAMLSRPLHKGYVQCTACEHWCAMAPGEAGKCGVRRNIDGKLQLLVYGRAAAVNIDPVEKKPLFHFLPGRPIFSIGTLGCNFRCRFCQNWDISQIRDFDPNDRIVGKRWLPEEIVAYCRREEIPLIAFTYNEPIVFFEYAYDTAKLAAKYGIRSVFVSSGFETLEAIRTIEPYLAATNIDLKGFTEHFYRQYTGGRLKPVMRNIEHIAKNTDIWIEVTTLLIPGLNDSNEEIKQMASFLAGISQDIPWHVTAFHPAYKMLDRPPTPPSTLVRAYDIAKEAGLNFVYVGNVVDHKRENTYCPHCGALLVERYWYQVQEHWQEPGVCPVCGYHVPGIWR